MSMLDVAEPDRSDKPERSMNAQVVYAKLVRTMFGYDAAVKVGRYRLLEPLGSGGMGEVYVAHDPSLDRRVALKLLRPDTGVADDAARRRLEREAQVMARLSHPNVVPVFDVGNHEGQVYVAMELIEGETLREWCDARARSPAEILELFIAAGRGLAAAHKAGIVHRDFKPENVLVGPEGRPRVVDFGLSLARNEISDVVANASDPKGVLLETLTAGLMGTPAYMAPEQFEAKGSDARSDQFSFCVALWSALYGEAPFAGEEVAVRRDNVLAGKRRPAPRAAAVPSSVRAALGRGLSLHPEDRFPDMNALLAALSPPPSKKARVLGIAIVALGFGLAGAWSMRMSREPPLCSDGASQMDAAWNSERAERVVVALGQGRGEMIRHGFDAYSEAWKKALDQRCEGPETTRYLGLSCLEGRLAVLDRLAERLGDPETSAHASLLVDDVLSPVEECSDDKLLFAIPPPPDDEATRDTVQKLRLELATAQLERGPAAVEAVADIDARAAKLGHRPLEAEAKLALGRLLADVQAPEQSEVALRSAIDLALDSQHDLVEAEAYVELVYVSGFSREGLNSIMDHIPRAKEAIKRVGDRPLLQARLNLQLSRALTIFGDPQKVTEEAIMLAEKSAQTFAELGRPSGAALAQLCLGLTFASRWEQARAQCEQALEITPPDHPDYRVVVATKGVHHGVRGDDVEGQETLTECIELADGREDLQPLYTGVCQSWLGNALRRLGKPVEAMDAHDAAIHLLTLALGPEHPLLARAHFHRGETWRAMGESKAALREYEKSLELWTKNFDPDFPELAVPRIGIAFLMIAEDRFEDARALLEDDVIPRLPRRSLGHSTDAQAHLALAQALAALGDTERSQQEAQTALDTYRGLGEGYRPELEQAEKLASTSGADKHEEAG